MAEWYKWPSTQRWQRQRGFARKREWWWVGGGGMREVMWDDDNGEKRETGDINDGKEPGKS